MKCSECNEQLTSVSIDIGKGEEGNDEDGSIARASLETSSSQQSYRRGTDCSFLAKEVKSYRDLYLIYEETRRPMKDELLSLKCRDAFDVLSRREELVPKGSCCNQCLQKQLVDQKRESSSANERMSAVSALFDEVNRTWGEQSGVPVRSKQSEVKALFRSHRELYETLERLEERREELVDQQCVIEEGERKLQSEMTQLEAYAEKAETCLHDRFMRLRSERRQVKKIRLVLKVFKPIVVDLEAFYIWFEGAYGTINNSRLGFLFEKKEDLQPLDVTSDWTNVDEEDSVAGPEHPVTQKFWSVKYFSQRPLLKTKRATPSWKEINSAWGWCALLLKQLSTMIGMSLAPFSIVPCGQQSQVHYLQGALSIVHNLYFEDDLAEYQDGLARLRVEDFALAVAAYAICLRKLSDKVLATDLAEHIKLREHLYPIKVSSKMKVEGWNRKLPLSGVKIGGYCVDVSGFLLNRSEADRKDKAQEWTEAMYCLLNNLNWLLVWVVQAKGLTSRSP